MNVHGNIRCVFRFLPNRKLHRLKSKRLRLYEDMHEHMNKAVVMFSPKAPSHKPSLRCEMQEWELWKEMRDVALELDAIRKEIEEIEEWGHAKLPHS